MSSLSTDPSGQEKPTFEFALEKLQLTVKKIESGELSLEESLRQFEEGVKLTRFCQEHLTAAEQRVELLMKPTSDHPPELQPFGSSSNRP